MFFPKLTVQALSIMGLLIVATPVAGQDTHRRLGKPQNLFTRPADDGPASKGKGKGKTQPFGKLSNKSVPSVDRGKVEAEDAEREATRQPKRFAVVNEMNISPANGDGTWEVLEDGTQLWRHRVKSPGCNSLNFGFCDYNMPEGENKLFIYDTKGGISLPRPFTSKDNAGESLWTPIIESCDVIIEVNLDAKTSPEDLVLSLCATNVGYRGFGTRKEAQHGKPRRRELSGGCNNDVVCPVGDDWRDEISSVAAYSLGGSLFCTGAMINNARQDGKPYFLTAHHCGVRANNADSLVVYWNYETSICGGTPDGNLAFSTEGAIFKATSEVSDFTLVELDEKPNEAWGVNYAGWDRSGADASSAVAIHHPSVDEKRISFENDATTKTSYGGSSVQSNAAATHVRVIDWDDGTTEGGSSGSPLFDQDHRIIGQLHGGAAACGNDASDWYGRFYKSWTGENSDDTRLSTWLDPGNSGVMTVDMLGADTASPTVSPKPTSAPTAFCTQPDKTSIQVNVLTDKYPRETSWELTNTCTGVVEAAFGGYSSGETLYSDKYCVPVGLYRFVFSDSVGDGICCSSAYGFGYYSVSYDGIEETRGGEFGSSETSTFGASCGPVNPEPTSSPSKLPTASPTEAVTPEPTSSPSKSPTVSPTEAVTPEPTSSPSKSPTVSPIAPVTPEPTSSPSESPTVSPTEAPTGNPMKLPSKSPSVSPTEAPTGNPTKSPSKSPTGSPTKLPSKSPTVSPTEAPTGSPTKSPSDTPTTSNPTPSTPTGCNANTLEVEVDTDDYPEESSWTLTNVCLNTLQESEGEGFYTAPTTTSYCVPDAQYSFVFRDSFGDGICCEYGAGSYKVRMNGEEVITGNGASGYAETASFGMCGSIGTITADYDAGLEAPKCSAVGFACTSGPDLIKNVGVSEPNQPNTLDACIDGTQGRYQVDESVEMITVRAVGGNLLQAGGTAVVEAKVYAYGAGADDRADFYYAEDATNPVWQEITTSVKPGGGGFQTITSGPFILPSSAVQAVRVNFRYDGSANSCATGDYDDTDDLVFTVAAANKSGSAAGSPKKPGPINKRPTKSEPAIDCESIGNKNKDKQRCAAASSCVWKNGKNKGCYKM